MVLRDAAFNRLVAMIRGTYGIDLHKKRALVEGRLNKILTDRGVADMDEYLDAVAADASGQEMVILLNKLTTNHTYFMREPEHFMHFRDKVLPQIAVLAKDHDIRVWSAGCSTGQEPYTLLMIMDEFFGRQPGQWEYSVLATDISMRALEIAQEGIYDNAELEDLPDAWRKRYLTDQDDGTSRFTAHIRNKAVFRPFNLMEGVFPFRKLFHVIFCRNVMIYFEAETKLELVRKYYKHTQPGGYLYIGQTESVARGETGYRYVMPAVYAKEG